MNFGDIHDIRDLYMWVKKMRVEQTGQVSRQKCVGMGKQADITETES